MVGKWDADDLAANRNLCAAVSAVAAALAGLAQTMNAPIAARIAIAAVGIVGALAGMCFHYLERRAVRRNPRPVTEERCVPRADLNRPTKFVNRRLELAALNDLLERAECGEGPIVAVLGGLPGVGKSAVGRYWANLVRERFTDGDLLADFSSRRHGDAVDVSGFLADFIRKLGPADAAVPATLSERVERFRSITYDRKLLILLDDVSDAAHVNQLRPSGKESFVIATSYRSLEELHYGGAELVPVRPLNPEGASQLLAEMAGEFGATLAAHSEETSELVDLCGGLALPLCVCGARLKLGHGAHTVASMVAEVADEQRRLRYLEGEGEYAGAAVFGFAYADLTPAQQIIYRRIGLHPGREIAPVHAALLAEISVADAREQLRTLAATYLLEPLDDSRFRFHDLVRLHAREAVERAESEAVREDLLSQLVDWYRASLRDADRALTAERLRLAPDEPISAAHPPKFTNRASVFAWLEAERSNILSVLRSAFRREWDSRVWQMVESLWLFYYNRRHYADWIDATEMGIASARRVGHRDAETRLRCQLAWAFVELGRFESAHAQLDKANMGVRTSENVQLRGSVREFTGTCYLKEQRYDEALKAFEEARELLALSGSDRGVALQDYFIGWTLVCKGEHARALEHLRASLATMRRVDDQMFTGRILLRVGQSMLHTDDIDGAETALQESMRIFEQLGMRIEQAETCEQLANVADARADDVTALTLRAHAQSIYLALGHPGSPDAIAIGPSQVSAS